MSIITHFLTWGFLIMCTTCWIHAQTIDCNSVFWTITSDGYIQQWSLIDDIVTGGDTILSGGGTSLSYCRNGSHSTFFSNNYSPIGITYYDSSSGWVDIPTPVVVDNSGGYLNDHYYMNEGAVIQVVKYWDGTNLLTVDSLNGNFFAGTFDIGVDTLGQAWVFTGPLPNVVDSLRVYNQNGRVNSYPIQFDQIAYGSFFLNSTLYIGTTQGSIFPIIIDGGIAQLGSPIPFPNSSFTDMASCHAAESITSINEYPKAEITLFPNPTDGYLTLPPDLERSSIAVYNSQGQLIHPKFDGRIMDLSGQLPGTYFVQINNGIWPTLHKIILQ